MNHKHKNCVTDPLAREFWRAYRKVLDEGNPLGVSFTEYVAARVLAANSSTVEAPPAAPWYMAACGHSHPLGYSCNQWAVT